MEKERGKEENGKRKKDWIEKWKYECNHEWEGKGNGKEKEQWTREVEKEEKGNMHKDRKAEGTENMILETVKENEKELKRKVADEWLWWPIHNHDHLVVVIVTTSYNA
jgi:hypothetical protein